MLAIAILPGDGPGRTESDDRIQHTWMANRGIAAQSGTPAIEQHASGGLGSAIRQGDGGGASAADETDFAAAVWACCGSLYVRPLENSADTSGARSPAPSANLPDGASIHWRDLIARYPWPVEWAERMIVCESGGNPLAKNGTSWGLAQINWPYHTDKFTSLEELLDPATNIRIAYELWADQGTEPWISSQGCWG